MLFSAEQDTFLAEFFDDDSSSSDDDSDVWVPEKLRKKRSTCQIRVEQDSRREHEERKNDEVKQSGTNEQDKVSRGELQRRQDRCLQGHPEPDIGPAKSCKRVLKSFIHGRSP